MRRMNRHYLTWCNIWLMGSYIMGATHHPLWGMFTIFVAVFWFGMAIAFPEETKQRRRR